MCNIWEPITTIHGDCHQWPVNHARTVARTGNATETEHRAKKTTPTTTSVGWCMSRSWGRTTMRTTRRSRFIRRSSDWAKTQRFDVVTSDSISGYLTNSLQTRRSTQQNEKYSNPRSHEIYEPYWWPVSVCAYCTINALNFRMSSFIRSPLLNVHDFSVLWYQEYCSNNGNAYWLLTLSYYISLPYAYAMKNV